MSRCYGKRNYRYCICSTRSFRYDKMVGSHGPTKVLKGVHIRLYP